MKKILFLAVTIFLFVVTMANGIAASSFENGIYTIQVEGRHTVTGDYSTANGRLVNPVQLEVQNNDIEVTLSTTVPLTNLRVGVSETPAETIDTNTYKFKVATIEAPTVLKYHQNPPGMDVSFNLVFLTDTLVKTAELPPSEEEVQDDQSTSVEEEQQNDNEQPNNNEHQNNGNQTETTPIDTSEKSGKYSIKIDAVRTDNGNPSMMGQSLLNPAIWEFVDEKIYAYVTFTNPLTDASVKNSAGDFVPFLDIINETDKTTYKFEIFDVNEPAIIETHIAANNNMRVDFKLVFDQSTLEKLDGETVEHVASSTPTPENNTTTKQTETNETKETNTSNQTEKIANPKTGDTFSMFYIAIAFLSLAGATYSLRLRKN
ncbi:hypothetical protein BKP45_14365 [Anaerobacillus alkalidiazotrophicus]|uniref:NEAT domain-containing protein n=1 Tax=Anaerobacillus alkalidiazotrophicus TaxID=472963 RepID=A0A1S2M594_9BACI|nr:NEAT domain-containing protein [Anaerobacillus alkalidiazotrophicus]OIJ19037.1 hypothetical protein BKP45_14365 [Anaerobacillus alkalidiazotrophicus]